MKIFQEGEHGVALSSELGRVPVVYRYRKLTLESGIEVESVLVGLHEDTGEVLVIPAQSTPRIKEAREGAKESVLEARVPRELEDVLELLADRYRVTPKKFTPALIRFYLHSAAATLMPRVRISAKWNGQFGASGTVVPEQVARYRSEATLGWIYLASESGWTGTSGLFRLIEGPLRVMQCAW